MHWYRVESNKVYKVESSSSLFSYNGEFQCKLIKDQGSNFEKSSEEKT